MIIRTKMMCWLIICLALVYITGCSPSMGVLPPVEPTTVLPTAPATLPEVIAALSSDSPGARLTAIRALRGFGKEAVSAVPALIQNLYYEIHHVQIAAAVALEELGPDARSAVPALIDVLQDDDTHVNVRRAATDALGRIGDSLAVPGLASILYEEVIEGTCEELVNRYPNDCRFDYSSCNCWGEIGRTMGRINSGLKIDSAVAIALITGEDFPDADSSGGYYLNDEGVPLVVIAAREWWESEGQYQEWPSIGSDE